MPVIVVRMRKGWRGGWGVAAIVLLIGAAATAAGPRSARPDETAIRLTLDLTWGDPALPALPPGAPAGESPIELEVGEGRVLEAKADDGEVWTPQPRAGGAARIGSGPSGRARVRIETTAGSTLVVRAGGVATQFPVVGLFDGALRTGANVPVPILIERVPWDALEVRIGPEAGSDGVFVPGSSIPMALKFNILLPERGEVAVRYWADLKPAGSGSAVWTMAPRREVMSTNATRPPGVILSIPAPKAEGSYVLEVHATWEPVAGAESSSRLARIFKKRRKDFPVGASRKVSLAILGADAPPPAPSRGVEAVSDSIDLTRARAQRAMASGRSPAPGGSNAPWIVPESALVESSRRDRLRGWGLFGAGEGVAIPPADGQGLAWSALPLRVMHTGRPHRLTVRLAEPSAADLAVALIAPGESGEKPRILLDAAASGGAEATTPPAFSWPVWPSSEEPVLVLVNRSETAPLRVASIELRELASEPAPAPLAETHPGSPRGLALHLAGPGALDRFGGPIGDGPPDLWGLGQNLAAYASGCGASAVVLEDARPDRPGRAALDGQAEEDPCGPERLDLVLRALARRKLSALLEVRFDGPLPGLPASDSPEALANGLVRVDRAGRADGPAYQPLRNEVREAMTAHAVEAIKPRSAHPNLLGLAVRLGPGATLPGAPDVGLDDVTYPQFARTAFQAEALGRVPGLDPKDPKRFESRWKFVTGPGREDWLDWRASRIGAFYGDLATAVKAASPGAVLMVATPGLDDGPAGVEARRADRAGLAPAQAWRAVGLDLAKWPAGPVVLRGVGASTGDLGHDLATSHDLDAAVSARSGRGLWLGADEAVADPLGPPKIAARAIADGPPGDELLGHALAVLDARWVIVSGASAAGQEERLARFARVYRALPAPSENGPPPPRLDSGVAVRSWTSEGQTFVVMANDTPYLMLMETVLHAPNEAAVDDLGRRQRLAPKPAPGGGRALVMELPPFGAAAVRVAAPSAKVEPVGPHLLPSGRDLDALRERLSARLDRIAGGGLATGPKNGDFEDSGRVRTAPVGEIRTSRVTVSPAVTPVGWTVAGDPASAAGMDARSPRSGAYSLRLDARSAGASVASAAFPPPGRSRMEVRAWLRADRADTPVRVWVEGEGGEAFRRSIDVQAGAEWSEVHLAARELPPGGLDRVRIRFERLAPGPLWIDDVSASGDGPPEAATRAQLVLTAALHAYRERRYADFARLAGSHWARLADSDPEVAPASARPSAVRAAGGPTDLPGGRRLR